MCHCFVLFFCFFSSQLVRKQKQVEEDKRAPASSAVSEASTSDFTEIPLSLPYQEKEEEHKQDTVQTPEATAQSSDPPSEEQQTEKPTSALSKTLQPSLTSSTVISQVTAQESKKEEEEAGGAEIQRAELKTVLQSTELEKDVKSWNQPCLLTQLEAANLPSAPALYPSLPTLEEGPVIQLHEEAVDACGKEPAVLALPEQESSPPSLRPLESVAEISRSKLYPELPKTASEVQVI